MKLEFVLLSLLSLIARPLDKLQSEHRPTVQAWRPISNTCKFSVKRIKEGPANWKKKIEKNKRKYKDSSFKGRETLYWRGYSSLTTTFQYNFGLLFGYYSFESLSVLYPDATLFGEGEFSEAPYTFLDTEQGSAGTCYIMAAMGAIAEFYDFSKKVFLTDQVNDVGIYAIKFYIRGKPWVVTIDDEMFVNDIG